MAECVTAVKFFFIFVLVVDMYNVFCTIFALKGKGAKLIIKNVV